MLIAEKRKEGAGSLLGVLFIQAVTDWAKPK